MPGATFPAQALLRTRVYVDGYNLYYGCPDVQQQVVARATRVVGSCGKAFKWLQVENPYFDGLVPIELLDTDDGAARVLAYITQYERDHPIRR